MIATLYIPGQPPLSLAPEGFVLPDTAGFAQVSDQVAEHLGCDVALVDVLDSGVDFVAYSIFDGDGEINKDAIQALKAISKHAPVYDSEEEEDLLRGAVLLISNR